MTAKLIQEGAIVQAVVRAGSDLSRLEKLGVALWYHQLDINDHQQIAKIVVEFRPDIVFNLATNRQGCNWKPMIETNLVSAMNLLNTCRYSDFCRFVSIGSSLERCDPKTETARTAYGAKTCSGSVAS